MRYEERKEEHRFYSEILENIDRGENRYIIYGGENVNDFFYSPYGTGYIHEPLIEYFLRGHTTKVIVLDDAQSMTLYTLENDKVKTRPLKNHAARVRWLIEREDMTRRSGIDRGERSRRGSSEEQTNTRAQEAAQQASDVFEPYMQCLKDISEFLKNSDEPAVVMLRSLDKRALLYTGKDHNLSYLEEIEKWQTIGGEKTMHIVFVFMKNIDILQEYWAFKEDSLGVIKVGRPAHAEITRQFREICNNKLPIEIMEKCATLSKGDGLKLKNAINIFYKTVQDMQGVYGDGKRFFETFKARIKTALSEEVSWEEVILGKPTKDAIMQSFHKFLNNKGKVKTGSKGIIFHGPPGTGKTHIAKALANMQSFYFMAPKLADIKGEFIGQSSKNMQRIFDEARSNAPTLIFLDELDTLFPMRGSSGQDSYQRDITNQFLAEVEGVDTGKQDVFVIGATNLVQSLDIAILSRFEQIEIALPRAVEREALFALHLGKKNVDVTTEDMQKLVLKSDGLSGRDIAEISEKMSDYLNTNINSSEAVERVLQNFHEALAKTMRDNSFFIKLYDENKKPDFESVIGYESLKKQARSMVNSIMNKEQLNRYNNKKLSDYNGLLLYGPPGNGKTFFAEALANEMQLDFVKVVGSSLASNMQDGAMKIFDEIVQKASKLSALHPIMLFFDEFDAIVGTGLDAKLRGTILDRITLMRTKGNILLIAATNYYERLDEATIRKGRFDVHLELPHPKEENTVRALIEFFCSCGRFDVSNLDFDNLLGRVEVGSVSSSDIELYCLDAQRYAIIEQGDDKPDLIVLHNDHFKENLT